MSDTAPMRWQPIADAPKDEITIDLWIEAEGMGWRVPGIWYCPRAEDWWNPDANYGDGGVLEIGPMDRITHFLLVTPP